MWNLLLPVILISIVVINAGLIIFAIIQFKRDWPTTAIAWKRMESFEKILLYMGFSFFIFIPAFKDHPSSNLYFSKVIIEILPALAGSFFVAGILAFMKQVHDIRKSAEQKKSSGRKKPRS